MSRPFWYPEHLGVPAELAPVLRKLLEPGIRQARRDGFLYGQTKVTAWLAELDRLAGAAPAAPHVPRPTAQDYISTVEAAAILGVGERRVRQYVGQIASRKVGNRRLWLRSEVVAQAEALEDYGTVRNGPASADRAS